MTSWDGGTLDEREYLIVRGTVQQIVYYNDENGYAVLRKTEPRSRRPARFPTLDWGRRSF